MAARPLRRTLLALTACLLLALAFAWALGRRPGAGASPQPTALPHELPDVAAAPPAEAPVFPERDASDIPHTKLPLRLLATVVSENPALSLATVEDAGRDVHEVMNEGQRFDGRPTAQIARIERARILIDNDGLREQLVISHRVGAEAAPVSPEEREHQRDAARRLRELADAGTNDSAARGGEERGSLAEGDVSPVYEDGELVGVQFDGIRAGGVYDRIGLRNGDVVTEINGVSLSDPAAMAKVIGEFVGSDERVVAVERGAGGAPETLVVSTPPLREAVQDFEAPPESE